MHAILQLTYFFVNRSDRLLHRSDSESQIWRLKGGPGPGTQDPGPLEMYPSPFHPMPHRPVRYIPSCIRAHTQLHFVYSILLAPCLNKALTHLLLFPFTVFNTPNSPNHPKTLVDVKIAVNNNREPLFHYFLSPLLSHR